MRNYYPVGAWGFSFYTYTTHETHRVYILLQATTRTRAHDHFPPTAARVPPRQHGKTLQTSRLETMLTLLGQRGKSHNRRMPHDARTTRHRHTLQTRNVRRNLYTLQRPQIPVTSSQHEPDCVQSRFGTSTKVLPLRITSQSHHQQHQTQKQSHP